jgi:SAM-dependent methyltransferase
MADAFDADTLAFYAHEAPVYVARRPDTISSHLTAFLQRLPVGGSILELGCGGGHDAAHMIAAGFDVDPTDGVPEMAVQAGARLDRPVRVMRFEDLDAFERYDAVVANASLLHVPRAALTGILLRVWRALRPGGWHLASYKTGGSEGFDELGRYYNRPSAEQAEAFYREAGDWCFYDVEESFDRGYVGKPSAWLKIVVQKAVVQRFDRSTQ